jgi:hypothetical protein
MGFFEWMFQFGLLGLAYMSSFLLLAVGLPVFLHHRRHVLALRGTHTKELSSLRERVDAAEKRCAKLEQQLVDVHMMIADETRILDKKLATILPDDMANQANEDKRNSRVRERVIG